MVEDVDLLDGPGLWQVWEAFGARLAWQSALQRGGNPDVIGRAVAQLPGATALDALEANRELVATLTAQRWYVMQAAREGGASRPEIGAALGMTKQGAQDWYHRRITEREQVVVDVHDAARARAALQGGLPRVDSAPEWPPSPRLRSVIDARSGSFAVTVVVLVMIGESGPAAGAVARVRRPLLARDQALSPCVDVEPATGAATAPGCGLARVLPARG